MSRTLWAWARLVGGAAVLAILVWRLGTVVVGHTATFLTAARTAGSTTSPLRVLPLAVIVPLPTGVPTNTAGWGPREGVTAWAFGATGLATHAHLPLHPERVEPIRWRAPATAEPKVATHG